MPVKCEERDGKVRLINRDSNQIETTEDGSPRDGGGHESMEACQRQAKTINNREYNSPDNNPRGQKRLRNP